MARYYDLVLGLIPAALFGITAVLTVGGVDLTTAVTAGASVSGILIGHAIFVNGPVDDDVPSETPAEPFETAD